MNGSIPLMQSVAVIAAHEAELRADGETSTEVPLNSVVVDDKPKPSGVQSGIFTPATAGVLGSVLGTFVGRPSGYPSNAGYPIGYYSAAYPGKYPGPYPAYQSGYPAYQSGYPAAGYPAAGYPTGYQTGGYPLGSGSGGYPYAYPAAYPAGAYPAAYPAEYPSGGYPAGYTTGYPAKYPSYHATPFGGSGMSPVASGRPFRYRYSGYGFMPDYHQPKPAGDILIRTNKGDYVLNDPFTSAVMPVSPRQRFSYNLPYPDDQYFY